MSTDWSDDVDPGRAGLTVDAFEALLDQEKWTTREVQLIRSTGMRVVTPSEASASYLPPGQLRPEKGYVVWDEATGKHLIASGFTHYKHAVLDAEIEAGFLDSFPPDKELPFWLVMNRPVPVYFGQSLIDELNLPGVGDEAGWGDVDEEMLDSAASAYLTLGVEQYILALTYMRGSLARELVSRPLRRRADWLTSYPHLIVPQLGGWEVIDTELAQLNAQAQFDPSARAFYEVLRLPEGLDFPESLEADDLTSAHLLIDGLNEDGFFEANGLHPWVDPCSLLVAPKRTLVAWSDSEFAELLGD